MTTTRRRLAVVTTSTLALAGALATPAAASTGIDAGCTLGGADFSTSDPGEVPLSHDDGSKRISVDPADGRFSGAVTATGGEQQEDCAIDADYLDTVVVRSTTLPAGTPVELVVTMTFDGTVTAVGQPSSSYSYADVAGTFSVQDPLVSEGGELARAQVALTGEEIGSSTVTGSSEHDWFVSGDQASVGDDGEDDVDGARSLSVSQQSATFTAQVGQSLRLSSSLVLFAGARQTTTSATVERFEVDLTASTAGVVLDRGDAQPEPEPAPTALELVQQARAVLAGYGLPKGTANSFDVKLRNAERALTAGSDACGALASFSAHLSALTGKKVTAAQAQALRDLVGPAQDMLSC